MAGSFAHSTLTMLHEVVGRLMPTALRSQTDHIMLPGHIQVTTRPQSAQRTAHAVLAGSSMTGEELLPPTPLEHEMCVTSLLWGKRSPQQDAGRPGSCVFVLSRLAYVSPTTLTHEHCAAGTGPWRQPSGS